MFEVLLPLYTRQKIISRYIKFIISWFLKYRPEWLENLCKLPVTLKYARNKYDERKIC